MKAKGRSAAEMLRFALCELTDQDLRTMKAWMTHEQKYRKERRRKETSP